MKENIKVLISEEEVNEVLTRKFKQKEEYSR